MGDFSIVRMRQRSYHKMPGSGIRSDGMALARSNMSFKVVLSYALDWVILIALGIVSLVLGKIEPNKRPFSLNDPNISFPHAETETVPLWLLGILCAVVPIAVILVVSLIFVPGATVPPNTPQVLVWKRKLWELHVGWLGLGLALVSATFFTQGMKNLFGKPRPDLLSRCQPDIDNAQDHVAGGFTGENPLGLLYYASICTQTDSDLLDDGFRSYPSGHSSGAAAGLTYLSLFLASKFAVTIPFVLRNIGSTPTAFPSRMEASTADANWDDGSAASSPLNAKSAPENARHNAKLTSIRRQAAAPPIYLLAITLAPFCLSIFMASSRWYDFRHHGFDILFGFIMGFITAVYSFRYYHLPIQEGAGWAWGPRSSDRAFWAGVGHLGYSSEVDKASAAVPRGRMAQSNDVEVQPDPTHGMHHRPTNGFAQDDGSYPQQTAYGGNPYAERDYDDVEMSRMDHRMNNRI